MDGRRFDDLTKGLTNGSAPRRRLLQGLAGGALAAAFGRGMLAEVAASNGSCEGKRRIDNDTCPSFNPPSGNIDKFQCRGRGYCFCQRAVTGGTYCVDLRGARCPEEDECDTGRDCRGPEQVCVEVGGCCGRERRNACIPLCPGAGIPDGGVGAASASTIPLLSGR